MQFQSYYRIFIKIPHGEICEALEWSLIKRREKLEWGPDLFLILTHKNKQKKEATSKNKITY